MTIIFFGSFQHYSALILQALLTVKMPVAAVVTTSADNHVANLAKKHHLPIFTPKTLDQDSLEGLKDIAPLEKQLWLTAGYGKLLPADLLAWPKLGALNLHFSLLPKYRGANPAEWAILAGETETGISLIEMSHQFDQGNIFAQAELTILKNDNRMTLYQKLYKLGAEKICRWLELWLAKKFDQSDFNDNLEQIFWPTLIQPKISPTPYAARFRRDDGFVSWPAINHSLLGSTFETKLFSPLLQKALGKSTLSNAQDIELANRALAGFPGIWTKVKTIKGEKRLKILITEIKATLENQPLLILNQVQLEGQSPATFNQIKNSLTI